MLQKLKVSVTGVAIFAYNKIIIRTVSARTSSKVSLFSTCFFVGRTKMILTIILSILLTITAVVVVGLTCRAVIRRRIIIQQTKEELKIEESIQAEGVQCEKNLKYPILVPGGGALV